MGSTSINEPPILIPPQFSTWARSVIYNIETRLFAMTPTPQKPCSNQTSGLTLGGYIVGEFPERYLVPPLDQCCVHWSKVSQLGGSYLRSQLPGPESIVRGTASIARRVGEVSESPQAQPGITLVGPWVSSALPTLLTGDLNRPLENECAVFKHQNR